MRAEPARMCGVHVGSARMCGVHVGSARMCEMREDVRVARRAREGKD